MDLHFVLAPSFHGATTLAQLLNNHPDVSCLGDTMPRTEYDQNCGCGNKVSACEFWRYIDDRFAEHRLSFPHRMYPISPVLADSRAIDDVLVQSLSVAALLTSRRVWAVAGRAADRYVDFYRRFMEAVNAWNGTTVYVSGQKSLQQVAAIKSILGDAATINIIHVIRDPRGFVCSERKDAPGYTLQASARRWVSYHRRVVRLIKPLCKANYLGFRYEDLCREPEPTMRRIFKFIGVEYQDPFFTPQGGHLMGSHASRTFTGQLRESETWKKILERDEQLACLEMTKPLSAQYGYTDPLGAETA
jgi:hypothetical protein